MNLGTNPTNSSAKVPPHVPFVSGTQNRARVQVSSNPPVHCCTHQMCVRLSGMELH